jgi:hypothetical protein
MSSKNMGGFKRQILRRKMPGVNGFKRTSMKGMRILLLDSILLSVCLASRGAGFSILWLCLFFLLSFQASHLGSLGLSTSAVTKEILLGGSLLRHILQRLLEVS